MTSPIFLICQGRSGGTIVAHALAEALNGTMLLEPFHDDLRGWVKKNPKRTPEHLRHDGVLYPYHGYQGMDLTHQVGLEAPPGQKLVWLQSLVDQAPRRPVIKVLRLWGHMQRLRDYFPEATIIHLHRDWKKQWESYSGLGFSRDYFGEYAYGYQHWNDDQQLGTLSDIDFHRDVWALAKAEGEAVADLSVSLGEVTHFGSFFTRRSQ